MRGIGLPCAGQFNVNFDPYRIFIGVFIAKSIALRSCHIGDEAKKFNVILLLICFSLLVYRFFNLKKY